MELIDSTYRFVHTSLGVNESATDVGVFGECSLGEASEEVNAGSPELEP
jgi:hypothetical protein